jgi:hypothetical protein
MLQVCEISSSKPKTKQKGREIGIKKMRRKIYLDGFMKTSRPNGKAITELHNGNE